MSKQTLKSGEIASFSGLKVIQTNDANPTKIDGLIYPRGALRFLDRDFPTGTSTPAMRKAKKRERLNKTLARRRA